jgi:hypothetical protein
MVFTSIRSCPTNMPIGWRAIPAGRLSADARSGLRFHLACMAPERGIDAFTDAMADATQH